MYIWFKIYVGSKVVNESKDEVMKADDSNLKAVSRGTIRLYCLVHS